MDRTIEIRLPIMPECWQTCGACDDGAVMIADIHVSAGDQVMLDDPIISLESNKTTLDIPSPYSGRVLQLEAEIGDDAKEGMLLLILETAV